MPKKPQRQKSNELISNISNGIHNVFTLYSHCISLWLQWDETYRKTCLDFDWVWGAASVSIEYFALEVFLLLLIVVVVRFLVGRHTRRMCNVAVLCGGKLNTVTHAQLTGLRHFNWHTCSALDTWRRRRRRRAMITMTLMRSHRPDRLTGQQPGSQTRRPVNSSSG